MNCVEAQGMVSAFIEQKMDIKTKEAFLEHVDSCEECMEELEIHFIFYTGMKQLDQEKTFSDDFHQELMDFLEKEREKIRRHHIIVELKRDLLAAGAILTMLILT